MFEVKRILLAPVALGVLMFTGPASSDVQAAQSQQKRMVIVTNGQEGNPKRVVVNVDGPEKRGYLGVSLADVTAENKAQLGLAKEEGALVQDVEKDSPAAQAGVQKGDVIIGYAGFPVFSAAQLARYVAETPVGRKVDVTVMRGGKKQSLESKIAQRAEQADTGIELPRRSEAPNRRFFGDNGGMFNFDQLGRRFQMETAARPRLGVSVVELSDQLAEKYGVKDQAGVLVSAVNAGSPAEKAGLKAGDIILEVDGRIVADADSLTRVLRRVPDGDSVELKISRDGKPMALKAQLEGPSRKSGSGSKVIL